MAQALNLNKIIDALEKGEVPAPELSTMLEWLGGTYGRMELQLDELEKKKPSAWLELRKTCKSNEETEMRWEMTEDGAEAKHLKTQLKIISKITPTLRSLLKHKEYEIHNQA